MPKAAPLQSNFNGGEFSPLVGGRVDLERYKTGLATCLNYVPMVQGGLTRRPGTKFIEEVKTHTKATRTVRFEFSTTQAYIIEFGDLYVRFYMDYGQIVDGSNNAIEVTTTYAEADLFDLRFVQSADVLYITHPSYAPRKLTRTSHTVWTLTVIDFLDGPYLANNIITGSTASSITITPSGATGSVTLTASAALWASTDVNRLVRLQSGGSWTWYKISAFTDTTHVTATVRGAAGATTAVSTWRLGIWSGTTGYPSVATFHEDRLVFAGATAIQQRFDMSNSSDYENFAPSAANGDVVDSRALSFSLNSTDVNLVRWLISEEKGLLAGTVGGEWRITSSFTGEPLSPSSVTAKQVTYYGSGPVAPVVAGKSIMFLQGSQRKLREMSYYFEVDGFRSPDRTIISEHITGADGIKEMAYQKEPQSVIWCARNDGRLVGMTYERDEDTLIIGWHRHEIGGVSDAAGSIAVVESVACIPSPDGTRDDLWMVVRRRINGATKRYIEVLTKFFETDDQQSEAFFVDGGLTYDSPKSITAATKASPGVLTSVAHGLSNGDVVLASNFNGMTELNGRTFIIANKTTDTFQLTTLAAVAVNTSSYGTYVDSGEIRKYVTTISGLDHLEGQEVDILADGAVQPAKTVVSGSITLSTRATTCHIGFGYNSDGQLLRLDAGAANGTSIGKTRRTTRVGFNLYRSLGLKIGVNFDELTQLTFRKTSDLYSRAVPLYTGILSEEITADYDFENQVCWRQDQPLPSTILNVAPQLDEQDRE